ncbi:MAG: PIN domain-containing protein [Solirubrobacterales bacterium]
MSVAADSSVLIAGFLPAHPALPEATTGLQRVRSGGRLIAHTLAETYATLSTAPFDVEANTVLDYLDQFNPESAVGIEPDALSERLRELDCSGIHGGATYDALIAVTARDHGLTLLTLDRRAVRSYEALGTRYELLWEEGS